MLTLTFGGSVFYMGQAIDFGRRNDYIGKPPDMTDEQCYALPVCRIVTFIPGATAEDAPVAVHAHVSCWKLTEEERAEVARTGNVFLKIIGLSLPPLSIHGIEPIYEIEEGQYSDFVLTADNIQTLRGE